ncbi:MAG: hypothetical protein ACFN3H_02535 [Spirochaetales bacterium]
MDVMAEGTVIRSINNIYSVRTKDGKLFSCRIKGKQLSQAKGEYNPIVTGDFVDFTETGTSEGLVTYRHDREKRVFTLECQEVNEPECLREHGYCGMRVQR